MSVPQQTNVSESFFKGFIQLDICRLFYKYKQYLCYKYKCNSTFVTKVLLHLIDITKEFWSLETNNEEKWSDS